MTTDVTTGVTPTNQMQAGVTVHSTAPNNYAGAYRVIPYGYRLAVVRKELTEEFTPYEYTTKDGVTQLRYIKAAAVLCGYIQRVERVERSHEGNAWSAWYLTLNLQADLCGEQLFVEFKENDNLFSKLAKTWHNFKLGELLSIETGKDRESDRLAVFFKQPDNNGRATIVPQRITNSMPFGVNGEMPPRIVRANGKFDYGNQNDFLFRELMAFALVLAAQTEGILLPPVAFDAFAVAAKELGSSAQTNTTPPPRIAQTAKARQVNAGELLEYGDRAVYLEDKPYLRDTRYNARIYELDCAEIIYLLIDATPQTEGGLPF